MQGNIRLNMIIITLNCQTHWPLAVIILNLLIY